MSFHTRRFFAAVGFVAMLVLSACGGGDGSQEIDALKNAKLISDQQAADLKNMLANVKKACQQEAQTTMAQIAANPTSFPPQALATLTKAANVDPNTDSGNSCQQAMTEYRVLAASFQNEQQRAAAEKDKTRQAEVDNLMNTNKEYKDKVLLALIKAIGSEANYVQNYDQLLLFATTYQSRIAESAAQFGFSSEAVAQLNSELNRVQAMTALRLAQQGNNSGGGVANGGSLQIGGGSGYGGRTGGGVLSFGQTAGNYATSPSVSKGSLSIGQGASSGGTASSGGSGTAKAGLQLTMGSNSRQAMRSAEVQDVVAMQDSGVLKLKERVGDAKAWFAKRRRANVTAY